MSLWIYLLLALVATLPFCLDSFCRMFNTQVQEGRLIASSLGGRLVTTDGAKGLPSWRPEASDATVVKQQGQGEKVWSGLDYKGLVLGEKIILCALQFGVRLAIIIWFRRLA